MQAPGSVRKPWPLARSVWRNCRQSNAHNVVRSAAQNVCRSCIALGITLWITSCAATGYNSFAAESHEALASATSAVEAASELAPPGRPMPALTSAQQNLSEARSADADRDYLAAIELCEMAESDAKLASAIAHEIRAEAAVETLDTSLQQLNRQIEDLQQQRAQQLQ